MARLLRLALVASVLYGAGAHWAALQSVAWAGMIATRVGESSWADAVRSTFSGEKPCKLCKFVDKGSAAEQAPALAGSSPSLDLAIPVFSRPSVVLPASEPAAFPSTAASSPSARPVVPPPKAFLPV